MKCIIYIVIFLSIAISVRVGADSKLIGKVVYDQKVCPLFYDGDRYIWFPKDVFVRSHFKSSQSAFDADNDGETDYLKLKQNFTTYQTNMMYYAYGSDEGRKSSSFKYIFPQSWMKCRNEESVCTLDNKISDGVLAIGNVPGKENSVYYRSRYTNVFPFMRDGTTYYQITTESTNKDVVAIVKPSPKKEEYEVICAFVIGEKL